MLCRQMTVTSGNQLVECQECHNLYHQDCHKPQVTDKEVNDPRLVWYCARCTRQMKRMVGVSFLSRMNTIWIQQAISNTLRVSYGLQNCLEACWRTIFLSSASLTVAVFFNVASQRVFCNVLLKPSFFKKAELEWRRVVK